MPRRYRYYVRNVFYPPARRPECMAEKVMIRVNSEQRKRLNAKKGVGESYADVLERLLSDESGETDGSSDRDAEVSA